MKIHRELGLINHLKATGIRVRLVINFGRSSLEWKKPAGSVWTDILKNCADSEMIIQK